MAIYILIMGLKRFKKDKLKISITSMVIIFLFLTIGGRIVWFIVTKPKDLDYLFSLNLTNLKISGCFFGGLAGVVALIRIFKEERRNILNTVIEGMFLGGGVAKVGCFINGCCIGKKTTLPWAISYPEKGIYDLHPVQLYEAIVLWIGFVLLIELKDKVKDSTRICISILWYFIMRMFILEGLYLDGQFLGNVSMRILYIITILICVFVILNDIRRSFKGEKKEK